MQFLTPESAQIVCENYDNPSFKKPNLIHKNYSKLKITHRKQIRFTPDPTKQTHYSYQPEKRKLGEPNSMQDSNQRFQVFRFSEILLYLNIKEIN